MNALYRFDWDTADLAWGRLAQAGCCARRNLLGQLTPSLDNRPDIREWILRHGRRSWPGDPLLRGQEAASGGKLVDIPFTPCAAAACAVAGDLAGALESPDVDDDLLDAACAMVKDLFADMGEADIEDCPDGVLILDRLVGHVLDRCDTLTRLGCVSAIHDWLEWPPESVHPDYREWLLEIPEDEWHAARARAWARREALGWTEQVRADLVDDCRRILRRPHWPDQIRAAFTTYEPYRSDTPYRNREGSRAMALAHAIGVDLLDDALRLLERHPLDDQLVAWLVQSRDAQRVERVIRLTERLLPRAMREASGETLSVEKAPVNRRTPGANALASGLQAMRLHGMYSERLVALGMRSPGARHPAGRVLEQVPPETWGHEVIAALAPAIDDERYEPIRVQLSGLFARLKEPSGPAPSS